MFKQTNTLIQPAPLYLQIFVCKYFKPYSLFIFWELSAEIQIIFYHFYLGVTEDP